MPTSARAPSFRTALPAPVVAPVPRGLGELVLEREIDWTLEPYWLSGFTEGARHAARQRLARLSGGHPRVRVRFYSSVLAKNPPQPPTKEKLEEVERALDRVAVAESAMGQKTVSYPFDLAIFCMGQKAVDYPDKLRFSVWGRRRWVIPTNCRFAFPGYLPRLHPPSRPYSPPPPPNLTRRSLPFSTSAQFLSGPVLILLGRGRGRLRWSLIQEGNGSLLFGGLGHGGCWRVPSFCVRNPNLCSGDSLCWWCWILCYTTETRWRLWCGSARKQAG
jgi:hypothetical protein